MSDDRNGMKKGNNSLHNNGDVAVIREFLHVQKQELEVRSKEADLARLELEHNKDLGHKSIDAQLEDSKLKFQYFSGQQEKRFIVTLVSVVLFALFMFYAMYSGNTDFAHDVLKLAIGAFAGYFVGKSQKSPPNDQKNNDD